MNKKITYNDLWNWIDSISIRYKNYEIKNAIVVYKFLQCNQLINNENYFNLKKLLSFIKWKLKLNLLMSKVPHQNIISKRNDKSVYDLSNKNVYVINHSPNNPRAFLHITPLVESDDRSLVITIRNDVYRYFNKIEIPIILLDVYNPWRKKSDLEINTPLILSEKNSLLSLDLFSFASLSRSASLIDLLDIITNECGLPKTLITFQDFQAYYSAFATYFTGKVPTITLQHGKVDVSDASIMWKYLISDWMIALGPRQAKIIEHLGVNFKKIKVLGSAKYDTYLKKINFQKKSKNRRILLGFQQTMFYKKNREVIFYFIRDLLSSKEDFTLSIRFHPAILKRRRERFIRKIRKMIRFSNVAFEISMIKDPLEDISKSMLIFTSNTTLAMEAMLLGKPVIEYLSSKRDNNKKFRDYRDFVLHAPTGKDAEKLIVKLLNNKKFYKKLVKKQNKIVNSEIMLPPAIPRILDFINSLSDKKGT